MDNNNENTMQQLRAEVKLLVIKGLIKPIPGMEHLSEETLRGLILEYKETKLKTINETICVSLVNGLTTLCKNSKLMPDEALDTMRDELLGNEGFLAQSTNIIGKITPFVPYIGFAVGFGIIGKYLYNGFKAAQQATVEKDGEE